MKRKIVAIAMVLAVLVPSIASAARPERGVVLDYICSEAPGFCALWGL